MKLRNKKTGMIGEVGYLATSDGKIIVNNINDQDEWYEYTSLAELNEKWEDYQEPEGWWFIDRCYEAHATNSTLRDIVADKEIGNYFETKEEAEKAVEKLKAWKRLKDKGISLELDTFRGCIDYKFDLRTLEGEELEPLIKDLKLLFGGEYESNK